MQGIQRFTKHEKTAGEGLSFSVIFRQLTPYSGKLPDSRFNEEVQIDWQSGTVPRAWRMTPDVLQQTAGTEYNLQEFNRRRFHPVQMCSVSTHAGLATSIVLHSKLNVVSPCGNKVWFVGYQTNTKSMALNDTLLATQQTSLIAVYKKIERGKRKFLGNFFVSKAVALHNRYYFELQKDE